MAMKTMELRVPMKQPAAQVWQTYIKNFQVTLPKLMPHYYSSIEYLEGPPLAPGGVVLLKYAETFEHYDYFKGKWKAVDHDKFYAEMEVIEGATLGKHFDKFTYSLQLLPGGGGADHQPADPASASCIKHWIIHYQDLGEHDFHSILLDEINATGSALESHLSNN